MKLSEFRKKYGEGTDFDLDWGKLAILALCIYIAIQVSLCLVEKTIDLNGKK